MININKMHSYQRRDFLDHVIWHLKDNNFYTFEDSDKRVFESNALVVTWRSRIVHDITIKSKLTNTEFELRVSVGCYDYEEQFVYKLGELFRKGSEWTAMKDDKFHKEFFGLKD
jgi:hypothetical protein|nr:MAG TPA: hypothetical protein [Caudoviricetes sp.]